MIKQENKQLNSYLKYPYFPTLVFLTANPVTFMNKPS